MRKDVAKDENSKKEKKINKKNDNIQEEIEQTVNKENNDIQEEPNKEKILNKEGSNNIQENSVEEKPQSLEPKRIKIPLVGLILFLLIMISGIIATIIYFILLNK